MLCVHQSKATAEAHANISSGRYNDKNGEYNSRGHSDSKEKAQKEYEKALKLELEKNVQREARDRASRIEHMRQQRITNARAAEQAKKDAALAKQKEDAISAQNSQSYLTQHFRIGWIVTFDIYKVIGATIDLGSSKLSDEVGGHWTINGYVKEFSEGRTHTEISVLGLFTVSFTNTTTNNGNTWQKGSVDFKKGALIEMWTGEAVTIDIPVGMGFFYEDTFTIGGN